MTSPSADLAMSVADAELLERTMRPYRGKRAIYLRSAHVSVDDGQLVVVGRFGIDEPCYIDDTGHFNAVESLICFNQIMYYGLARAVRDDLLPELAHWTLDDYWARQLPDVLIYRQELTYRRPIAAAAFAAEFRVRSVDSTDLARSMLKLSTVIAFSDDQRGKARGTVDLALVNVPPAP